MGPETEVRHPVRGRTIGDALDPRRNSLNFLRLALAVMVIASHAVDLMGYNSWYNATNRTQPGTMPVYGFFGISGYLIAGSAVHHGGARYLWQRFLRIFPAFWVCLAVTAFGFGVIDWLSTSHVCSQLSCYLGAGKSPYDYVFNNFFLKINQSSIAGTPTGSAVPLAWNGSLWTLYYEFICYLLLLALALCGFLKHRTLVLATTVALICAIGVITLDAGLRSHFSLFENWMPMNIMRFAAIFLTGSLIYLYRDKVPDSGWLAGGLAVVFIGSLYLPRWGLAPAWGFTPTDFFAPLLAYPLMWLGAHLPFQRIGARNDYSYGMYIYAFPVQQLLATWGVIHAGIAVYLLASVAFTIPFAVASWWLIEKHALRLKRFDLRSGRIEPAIATPATAIRPEWGAETITSSADSN